MVAPRLSTRLKIARIAHAWALLPLLFMLASLPVPPAGQEVRRFVVLLACVAGSAAVIYGITRRRTFARPVALLLGIYALVSLVGMAIGGRPDGPAQTVSMLVAGSVWVSYIAAMLCVAARPDARPSA